MWHNEVSFCDLRERRSEMMYLADPPGKIQFDLDFTKVNWWWFTVVLFIVFAFFALRKKEWARPALGCLVGVAIGYAIFMVYALPWLKTIF